MKSNLHINATPMNAETESRTGRSVDVLVEYDIFDRIDIASVGDGESDYRKEKVRILPFKRDYDVARANLLVKTYFTFKWCLLVYKSLSSQKYDVINCHSINLLPLSVLLKYKSNSKLIYDIHELETETHSMTKVRKFCSKIVEKILIRFVDFTIVVSEPIKDWYVKTYSIQNVAVIKNMPSAKSNRVNLDISMRGKFDISINDIVFVYHGALLEGRGIENLFSVFTKLKDKSKHLVVIGFGELEGLCQSFANNNSNIHFNEVLQKDELLEFIKEANIGLNFIDNSCLNHEYCLPNKLWDYLSVPMPVMVNDLVGMRTIVEKYDCGWLIDEDNNTLLSAIENLPLEEISEKHMNAKESLSRWGWDLEKIKLINIYKGLQKND